MAEIAIVRKGDRIEIGDRVRVEAGPARHRRRATPEALSDEVTAAHYQVGAPDALGEPIVEGQMFTYLDWLGPRVFYVFERVEIDPSDPRYKAGAVDPSAPALNDDTTNVTAYSYVFEDRGNYPTEDEAVENGQALAAKES